MLASTRTASVGASCQRRGGRGVKENCITQRPYGDRGRELGALGSPSQPVDLRRAQFQRPRYLRFAPTLGGELVDGVAPLFALSLSRDYALRASAPLNPGEGGGVFPGSVRGLLNVKRPSCDPEHFPALALPWETYRQRSVDSVGQGPRLGFGAPPVARHGERPPDIRHNVVVTLRPRLRGDAPIDAPCREDKAGVRPYVHFALRIVRTGNRL